MFAHEQRLNSLLHSSPVQIIVPANLAYLHIYQPIPHSSGRHDRRSTLSQHARDVDALFPLGLDLLPSAFLLLFLPVEITRHILLLAHASLGFLRSSDFALTYR